VLKSFNNLLRHRQAGDRIAYGPLALAILLGCSADIIVDSRLDEYAVRDERLHIRWELGHDEGNMLGRSVRSGIIFNVIPTVLRHIAEGTNDRSTFMSREGLKVSLRFTLLLGNDGDLVTQRV
jgi:hypothetical protein